MGRIEISLMETMGMMMADTGRILALWVVATVLAAIATLLLVEWKNRSGK